MDRKTARSFIALANNQINEELSRYPVRLGEIPDINIGEIVGRALDFLRRNGVPAMGYNAFYITIVLTVERPDEKSVTSTMRLLETVPSDLKKNLLAELIERMKVKFAALPRQSLKHKIEFTLDTSQLSD